MATSTIPFDGSKYQKVVDNNYGFNVYHASFGLLNVLVVQGSAAGTIGTSGHTITLPNSVPNCPLYLQVHGATTQRYMVALMDRTVTIMPREGAMSEAYINVTFTYSSI